MITIPSTPEASAVPVFSTATRVSYLGHAATIVHGNEGDDWTFGKPSATVNIRLDRETRGLSRQMDVLATSLIRL